MNELHEEELDFELEDELGTVAAAQAKIKKLRGELKEAQAKRDEYLDGWQRCKADSINARKEAAQQHDRAHGRGKESIIEEIIPVLDSFDMAAGGDAWLAIDENWRNGVDLIRNQLLDVLSRHGIERFGKVGDMFDHTEHEAVQEIEDVAGESGEVVRILRYGYKNGERIVRPAQVIVKR
ncbi:MAG TPA: nucleotide exchange factor GrpE [Candidatus Paceibacterota bacterium]|nr:nucleotide exchange factor GrpE [Candidatus Paceibacterota bacterium]